MRPLLLAAFGAILAGAAPAPTQPSAAPGPRTAETLRSLHLAGRNLLGILQYCQAQGLVGADAVDRQRELLRRAPPADVPGLDAMEEAGRQGIVAFMDSRVPIADAARAEGILVGTRCQGIALSLGTP